MKLLTAKLNLETIITSLQIIIKGIGGGGKRPFLFFYLI